MPDRNIYVKYKLDEVEARLASIRARIMKQEVLDPREIKRRALHGEYVAPVYELFFVDSEEGIKEMLRAMEASIVVDSEASRPEPALSVDTEDGISLLQILVHATSKVYIIDFHTSRQLALGPGRQPPVVLLLSAALPSTGSQHSR